MQLPLFGVLVLFIYFLAFVIVLALISKIYSHPGEMIRKSYHLFCSLSILSILKYFEHWYHAAFAVVLLIGTASIFLYLTNSLEKFQLVTIERKG